jgi:predicted RNA-binding protein with PIN domain
LRILIDGYNLIRRVPELAEADRQDLQEGRDLLISQLAAYRSGKGHRITVVFDGAGSVHLGGSSEKVKGVSVIYAPQGRTADDVIRKMCAEGGADLLVTADRQLLDTALRFEITPMDPHEFWDKVIWEQYSAMKGLTEEDEEEEGKGKKEKGGRKLKKRDRLAQRRKDKL